MPLLLDLLPSGLTVAPEDTIVVVCFTGTIVASAVAAGLVGVNADVVGLVLVSSTATGRVFVCS